MNHFRDTFPDLALPMGVGVTTTDPLVWAEWYVRHHLGVHGGMAALTEERETAWIQDELFGEDQVVEVPEFLSACVMYKNGGYTAVVCLPRPGLVPRNKNLWSNSFTTPAAAAFVARIGTFIFLDADL